MVDKGKSHSLVGSSAPTIRLIGRRGGKPSSEHDFVKGLLLIIYSAIFTQVKKSSSVGILFDIAGKPSNA